MAKSVYIGVNNVARKVKKGYIGVNGVARKIKKAYIGDINNIARLFYGSFPEAPTEYTLIETITSSKEWTAPEDGYFQIEVFGASGDAGRAMSATTNYPTGPYKYTVGSGGGGGGSYACSQVKMNTGDKINLVIGGVGSNTTATINSSLETYEVITTTSGGNGSVTFINILTSLPGSGGTATGGNIANVSGKAGGYGSQGNSSNAYKATGGEGGASGHKDGNVGGEGGGTTGWNVYTSYGSGKSGFIRISRGNTN